MAIKTLIIDDSVLYRKLVSDVAGSFNDIEVMGVAASGPIALRKLDNAPADLIFCDVHMPDMDGVQTLQEIKKKFPATEVVMMSGISDRHADITIKALSAGAIDFIKKPDDDTPEKNKQHLRNDIQSVLRMVTIRLHTSSTRQPVSKAQPSKVEVKPAGVQASGPVTTAKTLPKSFGVVAIGVSTGGPEALNRLIPSLPASIPVPIVLVQHMPPKFTRSLAESLDRKSALHVVEAEEGEAVTPGMVYIAPGGRHMTVRSNNGQTIIALNDGPPENSCRPAVDVLFRSVSSVYGDHGVLAVILTGMGNDGLRGVTSLKRKGCLCITQSPETCVVYGMPRAVDEKGLSDASLPLAEIGTTISKKLGCFG